MNDALEVSTACSNKDTQLVARSLNDALEESAAGSLVTPLVINVHCVREFVVSKVSKESNSQDDGELLDSLFLDSKNLGDEEGYCVGLGAGEVEWRMRTLDNSLGAPQDGNLD